MSARSVHPHSSHWGVFEAEVEDGQVVSVHPYPYDAHPSPILANIPDSVRHPTRISQPMVRAGWLDYGPGPSTQRGKEPFVPVSWETATGLLAAELRTLSPRAESGSSLPQWSGRLHLLGAQLQHGRRRGHLSTRLRQLLGYAGASNRLAHDCRSRRPVRLLRRAAAQEYRCLTRRHWPPPGA